MVICCRCFIVLIVDASVFQVNGGCWLLVVGDCFVLVPILYWYVLVELPAVL